MWKWSVMTLCGVQAIWAAHTVTGYDAESFLAIAVITIDILILFTVSRMWR